MALTKDEVNFYNDQGYLLVEDVISENQHKEMLALVDGFFEKSKMIKENDNIFIPKGSKHRLSNKCNVNLIVIEMWYGDKLDENDISPEELSVVAEKNCSIGYLTNTRSILKSINFTNKEILAQYLKDNIIKFCE